jgi:hypothetical protein
MTIIQMARVAHQAIPEAILTTTHREVQAVIRLELRSELELELELEEEGRRRRRRWWWWCRVIWN